MKFLDAIFSGSIYISGSFTPPKGTRDQRPTNPVTASVFFETSDSGSRLLIYNGSGSDGWQEVGLQDDPVPPPPGVEIEYLVVAGGGSGGKFTGGGGAGGLVSGSISLVTSGSNFTVTVGAGGSAGTTNFSAGTNGASSSLAGNTITTIDTVGGGAGIGNSSTGVDGGSGGGNSLYGPNAGGAGTVGQGNDGGTTTSGNGGTGGGGASQVGSTNSTGNGGDGGDGKQSNITGTATYYAGGGGGCLDEYSGTPTSAGAGGQGGGGAGGAIGTWNGTAGTDNTGGGGGAGSRDSPSGTIGAGSNGGSGVVILAYPSSSIDAVGGIVGDAGNGRKYHQFNESGTFKVGSTSDFNIKTDNLVAHYDAGNFNSRGTSTWTDLQGSYNASISSATLGSNFYYNFNGSSYASTGINHSSFTSLTYIIWLYTDTNTGGSQISGGDGSSRNKGQLGIKTSVNRFDYISIGADYFRHALSVSEGWHHFAVTDNGDGSLTAATLYIDTSSVSYTNPVENGSYLNNTNIQIGRGMKNTGTFDYDFNGNLAQVRIYNTVLSAAEIAADYNATKTNFV